MSVVVFNLYLFVVVRLFVVAAVAVVVAVDLFEEGQQQ